MIEIPTNKSFPTDYETVVSEVMNQLSTGQDKCGEGCTCTAYIDWGIINDTYKNCPSRLIAYKVATEFKVKCYSVYVQRMGFGNKRIPEGTPICCRIYKEARKFNSWDEL